MHVKRFGAIGLRKKYFRVLHFLTATLTLKKSLEFQSSILDRIQEMAGDIKVDCLITGDFKPDPMFSNLV